ncbi:MAG: aspartate-semialdehyde dehydrogenase [Dehalococcoidia bacterium]|nr:aspartate-semialdehyde dehydrogenase [Dehalococcoidia bacterium]
MGKKQQYNITVIGATGAVGQEFLRVLEGRAFPLGDLRLLASARSAGRTLRALERDLMVEETTEASMAGADFVFISATSEISRQYAPIAARAGAIAIDDSSVWRMDPAVPLVVPEVNADDLAAHQGIVAIPNCSTTPLVMALDALRALSPLRRVVVDTYQAVSGTGAAAVQELQEQTRAHFEGRTVAPAVYPHPIAFNVLPQVDSFLENGYTKEEWKMVQESRKILHLPDLALSATCVRVPVMICHSEAVHVEFAGPVDPGAARKALAAAPGIVVQDDVAHNEYPQPLTAAGTDPVYVGRIRTDASNPNGLAFWVVSDNLRKGAALNAIQIAETMIARNIV